METIKNDLQIQTREWTLDLLQKHIQYAVDLEFWTIPFYMSAMYSVKDRSSDAYQFIQTAVNQEMLHLQSASNIANAYGFSPTFNVPVYVGKNVPHLNFDLDKPDPRPEYSPFSAEIGPLDLERINAMCLIEYPDWDSSDKPDLNPDVTDYGNIGEFYLALRHGADQLKDKLHGGVKQVDLFSNFYRNMPAMTITESGRRGFYQVDLLIKLITEQGEGISKAEKDVQEVLQNTADDKRQELSHFEKFIRIKTDDPQATYPVKAISEYTDEDRRLLEILQNHFSGLCKNLEALFNGENPEDFFRMMLLVGADIQNCWKHEITPVF